MKGIGPKFTLLFFILAVILTCNPVQAEKDMTSGSSRHLLFGIAPFMSPLALVKRMAPLRDYLSERLGITVTIETSTDAKEFTQRTLNGRYDFVLTNPTFSLMALDRGNFQIIATQKQKLAGYFITLNNSPIETIDDLAGKKVGAPPKIGFMGQLITPYLNNIDFPEQNRPEIIHFNSHNAAVSALRLGDTNATLIVNFMEKHLRKKGLPRKSFTERPNILA